MNETTVLFDQGTVVALAGLITAGGGAYAVWTKYREKSRDQDYRELETLLMSWEKLKNEYEANANALKEENAKLHEYVEALKDENAKLRKSISNLERELKKYNERQE